MLLPAVTAARLRLQLRAEAGRRTGSPDRTAARPLPRRRSSPSPALPMRRARQFAALPIRCNPSNCASSMFRKNFRRCRRTPFLEGLLDAPTASASNGRADGVELPCPALRASRRIGAASIDAVVTLAGAGLFAAAAARFLPGLPPAKFLIAGAVAVSVLLWASYQYLFLVYWGARRE